MIYYKWLDSILRKNFDKSISSLHIGHHTKSITGYNLRYAMRRLKWLS